VRRRWHDAVRGLALLEPGGFERWIADAPSAGTGRAHTALVPLPAGGPRVVVRRLHHGGLLGSVLGERYAGPTRVIRELEVTAGLRAAGAPVPDPVLALARRRRPGFALAIATVHEADTMDALAFLRNAPEPERMERAAAAAGAAVRRFHDAGGRHADLHVKNLLLRETEAGTEAIVIDLDRGRLAAPPTPRQRAAELGRLGRSLWKRGVAGAVGRRGTGAFLAAYCAGDAALREALVARLPAERRKARLHALRYR
jgi:3-deoxy-D-manno-octulosonic acid kinase